MTRASRQRARTTFRRLVILQRRQWDLTGQLQYDVFGASPDHVWATDPKQAAKLTSDIQAASTQENMSEFCARQEAERAEEVRKGPTPHTFDEVLHAYVVSAAMGDDDEIDECCDALIKDLQERYDGVLMLGDSEETGEETVFPWTPDPNY
jgi:hypothetical protein